MKEKNRFYSENEIEVIRRCTRKIFAPVLSTYVSWLLQDAKKKGIRRLYFLARDGYLMYETARTLSGIYYPGVECRYLYCSRKVFHTAQYHISGSAGLEYLCRGGTDITYRKILERVDFTEEQTLKAMKSTGYSGNGNEILSYRKIQSLKKTIEASQYLLGVLYDNSREPYKLTMEYLSQEGLLEENVSYALVDSGWTGGIQNSLYRLLHSAGWNGRLQGYYFGLYELSEECCRLMKEGKSTYTAYFFSPEGKLRNKLFFNNNLFEVMCSAPEGMTCGYKKEDGIVIPVLERQENINQEFMLLTVKFFNEFIEQAAENSQLSEIQKTACENLKRFMTFPTREEANVYGGLLFSDDTTEEYVKQLSEGAWPEGRICLENRFMAGKCLMIILYKYIRYMKKEIQYRKMLKLI